MSDTSQGPGWWIASDGKWYPPQPQQSPVAPPVGGDAPPGPGWWRATDGKWYPPLPGAGQGPTKKFYTRVWFWILVVVALAIGGCVALIAGAGVAIHHAATTTHTVVYSVTGSGTADISYDSFTSGNSGSSQESGATLPWSKIVTATGLFSAFTLTAQIQTGDTVTCTITVDGKQVSTNTATGQYGIASCTGSAS